MQEIDELFLATRADSFFRRWDLAIKEKAVWPLPIGLSCCALEFIASTGFKYDGMNYSLDDLKRDPEEADFLIVAGTVTKKFAPFLINIYNKMPKDKWVLALGACAASGGPYFSPSVVQGVSQLFPVDVYVPGCPPSPEQIEAGMDVIRRRIGAGIKGAHPLE